MRRLAVITALFLLSCVTGGRLSAQENWDSVLNRYEQIVLQCKTLRLRMAGGDSVQDSEIASLLNELGMLRSTLQAASGSMTPEQRARFAKIRNLYNGAETEEQSSSRTDASRRTPVVRSQEPSPSMNQAPPPAQNPGHLPYSGYGQAAVKEARAPVPSLERLSFRLPALAESPSGTIDRQNTETSPLSIAPARTERSPSWSYSVHAFLSYNGKSSYGIHASRMVSKWGGYVSVRSNFVSAEKRYDCLSDGTVPGGGSFWGTGASRISEAAFCVGPVRSLTPWMEVYAGLGYGWSELRWKDSSGLWARVTDASAKGAVIDGGAMFRYGRLSLLAGVSWLCASPETGPCSPSLTVGIGISL